MTFEHVDHELIRRIGAFADENKVELYIVGGAVRDEILGRNSKDIDFTIVGDAVSFVQKLSAVLKSGSPVVFEKFGTAMLPYRDGNLEFVGTRKEVYDPSSRKPVVSTGTLEDDLARRDFTCNTIAVCVNHDRFGELIDPYRGSEAIERKLLTTPLDPEKTFSDDPLRMMRACRFAAQLDFEIDARIQESIRAMASRISIVSIERIRDELVKIMESRKPSIGLDHLYSLGLLRHFFPELHALAGVDQRKIETAEGVVNHHHKDVFYHTLLVVDNIADVTDNLWLRISALLHDIAKPQTKHFDEESGWSFHGHEIIGARAVKTIFQNLRLPMEPIRYVQKLVALHLRPIALANEEVTDSAIRRLLFEAGEDIDDLIVLCRADITSKNPAKVNKYLDNYRRVVERMLAVEEKDRLRNWQPPLRGDEIMALCGIGEGAMVGVLKTKIEDAILDGIIANDREEAIQYLQTIKEEILAREIITKPLPAKRKLKSLPTNLSS